MWQTLTRYVTSLVHSRACWPVKSRCSEILVSRARTLVAYIPKRCSPVRGTARDSLVSLVPPSLGGLVSLLCIVLPTSLTVFIDYARETEPDAFVLDVFFNAHPIGGDSKQKPKATNALVPTSIAYAGGCVDFRVDMGSEVRLSTPHRVLAEPSSLVYFSSHDSKREFHQTLHGHLWRRCV
jgi:hypothetical protein